ncbi:MAG: transcriptional regulator [Methanomassiliicoccaceae archaeon]|nr:transcriptional regulator [Methanomassiliicoccaceae archaeon]MCL2145961.1 transcriptional regulator [Methanomassiliicoccaceae archaeon]
MTVEDLISSMLREEGGFQKAFRNMLYDELDMSLSEFCSISGISQSTMYKLLEEKREPNLRTVRDIIRALTMISRSDIDKFVAVIASSTFMESLPKTMVVDGRTIFIREYPISTVEDAIIAAVRAERDGALAIVCAPIIALTVKKILRIPVSPVMPLGSVLKALDDIKGLV